MNHPVGATFSYCNSGFILAGRLVKVLTGGTWDQALHDRMITPLGLSHRTTLPEEAILGRAAVGHLGGPEEDPRPTNTWGMPRSSGPCGLINSTPHDALEFARAHLLLGLTRDQERLLGDASARLMQQREVVLPGPCGLGDSWGLGWARERWGDHDVIGHNGGTIGQTAFLRLVPEAGLAICLLTNGGRAGDLYRDLVGEITQELLGTALPPAAAPAGPGGEDASGDGRHDFLGAYERTGERLEFTSEDGALVLRTTATGDAATLLDDDEDPVETYEVRAGRESDLVVRRPGARDWTPVTFYELADGSPYVLTGVRSTPKVTA